MMTMQAQLSELMCFHSKSSAKW